MAELRRDAPTILFVDDEMTAVKYFRRAIETLAPVVTADSVEVGKRLLDAHAATLSVLVSDQRMAGGYGNELLHYASDHYPHVIRILTSAYAEIDYTVEAINAGKIHRYIKKPWDIDSLRIEMQMALELATLRKERDRLVGEKLTVLQRQVTAVRIGLLHAICTSLCQATPSYAIETYLAMSHAVGVTMAAPNWRTMDYAALIGAEAERAGQCGAAMRAHLKELEQRCAGCTEETLTEVLNRALSDVASSQHANGSAFFDARFLAEYLETSCDAVVSVRHARWLAFLCWLDNSRGGSLETTSLPTGLACRVIRNPPSRLARPLAEWMEQFD